jgi:hypothetical protein
LRSKDKFIEQYSDWALFLKQDAAGLTKLSASVEDVFASGDLSQAAETLANMRHCLSVVGEVCSHMISNKENDRKW